MHPPVAWDHHMAVPNDLALKWLDNNKCIMLSYVIHVVIHVYNASIQSLDNINKT